MDKENFESKYWYFYLDLEEEFLEISKTIPIDSVNKDTFSFKYMRLLMAVCSEINILFRKFMDFKQFEYEKPSIGNYEEFIDDNFNDFKNASVNFYKTNHNYNDLSPFNGWNSSSPEWWSINNKLKHNRDYLDENGIENYKYVNQLIVLNALAGLFVLEMYFYREIIKNIDEEGLHVPLPQSEIFRLNDWGDYYKNIVANKYFFEFKDDGHLYLTTPDC